MDFNEFKDIDVSNLSTMDEKTRQETIMMGKDIYIKSIKDVAERLEIDFIDLLSGSIYYSEEEIERQIEKENYELCYFLHKITNELKKEYYGL